MVVLFASAAAISAETARMKVPVRLVAPAVLPVVLEPGEELPRIVVRVSNPTPFARQVVVEAFAIGEDKTLLARYAMSEDMGAGDHALMTITMEPCHAGFTEAPCTIAEIQVRAYAGERQLQPQTLPSWLQLANTEVTSSLDSFDKRQAEASVVVTNTGIRDVHVYLRFRLYNRAGLQVAVCRNEPRPIFTDSNLLVPAGLSVRVRCGVSPFEDVPDAPSKIRVDLLGWEERQ